MCEIIRLTPYLNVDTSNKWAGLEPNGHLSKCGDRMNEKLGTKLTTTPFHNSWCYICFKMRDQNEKKYKMLLNKNKGPKLKTMMLLFNNIGWNVGTKMCSKCWTLMYSKCGTKMCSKCGDQNVFKMWDQKWKTTSNIFFTMQKI